MRGYGYTHNENGSFHSSENQRLLLLRTTHLIEKAIQASFTGRLKELRDQGEPFHVRSRR